MPQPIYIPWRNPLAQTNQMLWQLALSKMSQKSDMEMLDRRLEAQKIAAQEKIARQRQDKGEERTYQLQKEGRKPAQGATPEGGVVEPITGTAWGPKPKTTTAGLQRKTRTWWDNGKQFSQEYNFDPATGTETLVGKPRVTFSGRTPKGWQRKTRVFMEGGKPMAQDYDYNPNTGSERPVGAPYEKPKSMSMTDFLMQAATGQSITPSVQQPQRTTGLPTKKVTGFVGAGYYYDDAGNEHPINNQEEYDRLIGR